MTLLYRACPVCGLCERLSGTRHDEIRTPVNVTDVVVVVVVSRDRWQMNQQKSDRRAGRRAQCKSSFRRLAEIDTDGVLQYKADFGWIIQFLWVLYLYSALRVSIWNNKVKERGSGDGQSALAL